MCFRSKRETQHRTNVHAHAHVFLYAYWILNYIIYLAFFQKREHISDKWHMWQNINPAYISHSLCVYACIIVVFDGWVVVVIKGFRNGEMSGWRCVWSEKRYVLMAGSMFRWMMDGWNKQVQCSDERIFGKSGGRNVLHGGIFGKMLEMKEHSDSKWKKRMFGKKKFEDRRQEKWQERQWTSLLEDNFQTNKRTRRNKRSSCDTFKGIITGIMLAWVKTFRCLWL